MEENATMNTEEKLIQEAVANLSSGLSNQLGTFLKDNFTPAIRKVTLEINNKPVVINRVFHEKFEDVLSIVANNIPVYLYGPAGTGKNYLCKQVADALGLNFYYSGAVTQPYSLTGFTDANGRYQETEFYKAVTNGGLFFLDEMDASIPEVLIILNACIANGYFDFPAPIGLKEVHKDFRIIAAGNTLGQGADSEYTGRYQLDATTLNRFAKIEIGYSPEIEIEVANGDAVLVQFCRDFRKAAKMSNVQTIVSYRQIHMIAVLEHTLTTKGALKSVLTAGLDKDELNMIASRLMPSKYTLALKDIISEMK